MLARVAELEAQVAACDTFASAVRAVVAHDDAIMACNPDRLSYRQVIDLCRETLAANPHADAKERQP